MNSFSLLTVVVQQGESEVDCDWIRGRDATGAYFECIDSALLRQVMNSV